MTATTTGQPTETVEAIRAALSPGTERDPDAYAVEGVTPLAAFEPADRGEVATLLQVASDGSLAVTPQGSRTAMCLGRPLDAYDLALDMRGLRRTVEYVPDDLTVTVEAGRRLGALQAELAEHGQYISVDPAPDDDVTVGGLLATGRGGAWRGHLPAARDLILGMEVALPTGELVHSGGRVVKNVTGYDLQRLHTGALGAFGVIVEATFKTAPLPASTRTLVVAAPTVAAASATAQRAWDAAPALRALTVLSPEAAVRLGLREQPTVILELAGTTATVERSTRDLDGALTIEQGNDDIWPRLRRMLAEADDEVVVRAGIPPTALGTMIEALTAAGACAWGHIAAGSVLGRFEAATAADVQRFREVATQHGGFLVVESGPAAMRREIEASAGDPTLVRALRDRFDMRRTINRGRWGTTL